MYKLNNGKLDVVNNSNPNYSLKKKDHLIIKKVDDFYVIINSFNDECLVLEKDQWNKNLFSKDVFDLLSTNTITKNSNSDNGVTSFVICLSYACNLKCTYCYQQNSKEIDKNPMSDTSLDQIFEVILGYRNIYPNKNISIELFGGEPLLKTNHKRVLKVLDFCVNNGFSLSITTNGTTLDYYLKDFIIYQAIGISIFTTIDSISNNSETRSSLTDFLMASNSKKMLNTIKIMIENGIHVDVACNIDKHNIDELPSMINYYNCNNYLSNKNFVFTIGRVDDRFFETKYKDIISPVKILKKLEEIDGNLTSKIYASFLRTTACLCKKIRKNYNQNEGKGKHNYCWATSPIDEVFYIGPDLNTFRCTYTVGRNDYSLFKFNLGNIKEYTKPDITCEDNVKCKKCIIGGYCAGGCKISADLDFRRQCKIEKEEFNEFLDSFFCPAMEKIIKNEKK